MRRRTRWSAAGCTPSCRSDKWGLIERVTWLVRRFSAAASRQEGFGFNSWGFPVWSLHVRAVCVCWVPSGFSSFLLQSESVNVQ